MTDQEKDEITKMSKEFAGAFKDTFGAINNTGWLIVDPLSGYLNACGYKNELSELPENKNHCQVLVMEFKDGSKFIPAGGDLKNVNSGFKNWMWC